MGRCMHTNKPWLSLVDPSVLNDPSILCISDTSLYINFFIISFYRFFFSYLQEGVCEIWLSSEDTGAYGRDLDTNIAELLNLIVDVLPKDVMLRVGMTNPPFILEHLEAVAKVLNHKNVFSFLHIPVQAGSNHVLKKMNREYTVEEFCQVADYLLEHVQGITIATVSSSGSSSCCGSGSRSRSRSSIPRDTSISRYRCTYPS